MRIYIAIIGKLMNLEKFDMCLGIFQKLAVIIGLCASAWFFFLKEESSPHVNLVATSKLMPQCILRVDVKAENKGGRVWQIENAIARVFMPDLERIQNPENLRDLEIGTQILSLNQSLRIGETASFGLNIKLPKIKNASFFVTKVAVKIHEEGEQWIRMVEDVVPANNC
jgi:hypothetical protein